MDVDVSALGMRASSETYEHIGAVSVWVHDLGRRWQEEEEEESRTRVMVDEDLAVTGSTRRLRPRRRSPGSS
jgi:hypothetical protein